MPAWVFSPERGPDLAWWRSWPSRLPPSQRSQLTQVLGELINPADYPALAAVQAAESAEDLGDGEALPAAFAFGVDRFLDGLEAWVAAR